MSIIAITHIFVMIVIKCISVITVIIELMDTINIILIITIARIIVGFQGGDGSHSRDLEPVFIIAQAENSSNTRAYQTELGETTKAPLLIPGGRIMTRSS